MQIAVCSTAMASGELYSVPRESIEGPSVTVSETGRGNGCWSGISAVALMSSQIPEGEQEASSSMLNPAIALPPPSGTIAGIGEEILAKEMRDQIESRPENNDKPVGRMVSRTDVGEKEDRTFRSSEGARLSSVCSVAMSSGGEANVFDLGGPDVKGSEAVTELSEVMGMRRFSVVV